MNARTEHARVDELIPWFVNGSLPEAERRLVQRHVRECLPCRASLNEARRTQAAIRQLESVPFSPGAGLDALMRRIEASDAPEPAPGSWTASPAVRRGALALAASSAFVAAAVWLTHSATVEPTADGTFSTLATPASASRVRIDLIFADDVSETDLREMISSIDGTIVAGPSGIGRYTIELSGDPSLDELLTTLNDDPRIRIAAPSYDGAGAE